MYCTYSVFMVIGRWNSFLLGLKLSQKYTERKQSKNDKKRKTRDRAERSLRKAERLTVEMLKAFLLLLHLQYLTSCDQKQYLLALCPVPARVRYPTLNGLSQPANHKCSASPTCCSGHPQSPQEQTNSAWGSLVWWERGGSTPQIQCHHQAWETCWRACDWAAEGTPPFPGRWFGGGPSMARNRVWPGIIPREPGWRLLSLVSHRPDESTRDKDGERGKEREQSNKKERRWRGKKKKGE